MADYTSQYLGTQVDSAVAGILAYSGSSTNNVRMASQIGLIPNDSTKGNINSAIISSLVTTGKSLFMDKNETYYITGGSWQIGYDFSIKGKATIVCSGQMFVPVAGASISFDGITFKNSSYIIYSGETVNYQINTISITNCSFSNIVRAIELRGADIDYGTTPFGIKELVIENCYFTDIYFSQFSLTDMVVSERCVIKNCYIDKMLYVFFNFGTTNSYVNQNDSYNGTILIDGNYVTGTVAAADYAYYTFALVEANRVVYTNNTITNLIGLGDATYDSYLSCIDLIYEGNIIKNVCNLPTDTQQVVYTEIMKSKSSGNRCGKNNHWLFDFNECRQLVSNAGTTYTDQRFSEINKVSLFGFVGTVDLNFCFNTIVVRGGSINCPTSSRYMRTVIFDSNVIDSENGIWGYIMPVWNEVTQSMVVTNNIFKYSNTATLALFGTSDLAHNTNANNMTLFCCNNYSTTPIRNIGSRGSGMFTFKNNSYKNYPIENVRHWYYLDGINSTRSEIYGISSKQINFNSFTYGAVVTVHSDIESQGSYMIISVDSNPDFDLNFPEINRTCKFRKENGVINVYDKYSNKILTLSNSFSVIIEKDNIQLKARYTGDNAAVLLYYYDSVGHHDIEFADKNLKLYDVNDDYEKQIFVVAASSNTLAAEIGKYYRYDSSVTSLAVTLPATTDTSKIQSVLLSFTTGSSPQITFTSADSKTIAYSSNYSIDDNTSYEINCLFNGVKWVIACMAIS